MHYVLVDAICAAANWGDSVLMRMSSKTPNARLPGELEPAAGLLLDYMVRAPMCQSMCSWSRHSDILRIHTNSPLYTVMPEIHVGCT